MTASRLRGLAGAVLLGLGVLAAAPAAHAVRPDTEPHQFTCTTEDTDTATTAAADTSDEELRAHPSGQEGKGETEAGSSGTQGRSDSDPDGMENGGADKPGCYGGYDDDRDGNNGCGNDTDFEDDNNGNCGGKGRQERPADDGPVVPFAAPDEDPEPAPAVKDPAPVVEPPAPVVDDPDPVVDEEPEDPIVWADEDPVNDPDPDDEYGDDDPVVVQQPAPTATGTPDMDLAATRDLARTGGLLAALGLVAAGALTGSGRRAVAVARRRFTR